MEPPPYTECIPAPPSYDSCLRSDRILVEKAENNVNNIAAKNDQTTSQASCETTTNPFHEQVLENGVSMHANRIVINRQAVMNNRAHMQFFSIAIEPPRRIPIIRQPRQTCPKTYCLDIIFACIAMGCLFPVGLVALIFAVQAECNKRNESYENGICMSRLLSTMSCVIGLPMVICGLYLAVRPFSPCSGSDYVVNGECYTHRRYALRNKMCHSTFSTCCHVDEDTYHNGYCFTGWPKTTTPKPTSQQRTQRSSPVKATDATP